jgi:hypothetical protein
MTGWLRSNELERISKEVVVANLRYYPGICLGVPRKNTKNPVRIARLRVEI